MSYLVLLALALLLWWFASWLGHTMHELRQSLSNISKQLERIEEQQNTTFEFMCHAVNNFAIISGETREDDVERQSLSVRILELMNELARPTTPQPPDPST